MDIMHIASVTIYSKIINEVLTKFDLNIYLLSGIFMFFFAKELCYRTTIIKTIGTATSQWFDHDESSMELTTHQKVYTHIHGKLKKQFYSDYYQALLYYLENLNGIEMSKFVEIMKVNYTESYEYENGREYMLIPDCNYRTKICEKYKNKHDIYIEVIKKNTYSENSKDKNDSPEESTPLYKFIISTPGKNNFKVLQTFMKEILVYYKKETQRKTCHRLYEFIRSYRDEDSRNRETTMEYREFPFNSNKTFDENIFFEGKPEFIKFIDRFCETDNKEKDIYTISGVTKKACILLSGPPGCGKSCVIKGILNRTGRDGIIVPWARLKSCNEFCNLFRSPKINDVPFELKNYVFIFEDFDANKSEILKQRKQETSKILKAMNSSEEEETKNKSKTSIMSILSYITKKSDDELNLECVLNTLDGIAELQDAMIIFTTNHLEQLDPAFYRSGRVDYLLNMKLASVKIIKEMIETYCQIENMRLFEDKFEKMKDYRISTADIQSMCFKYGRENIEQLLTALIEKMD